MSNLINFKNSIINTGGASYNLLTGDFNPDSGYFVSIEGAEKILPYNKDLNIHYDIASYIKEHAYILLGNAVSDSYYLGAWVNDGKLYLDISILVNTRAEAELLTRSNNQLAYFDNSIKESIEV